MVDEAVFIDTSYLLALELEDDQVHQAAIQHWSRISLALPILVTTSYILDEVVTYLSSRRLHAKAVELGARLLNSPSVQFVHVDEATFFEGWAFFQRHRDKDYSLTDCISFVVMRRAGLTTAFSFDRHFIQAGFITEPLDP
jgi:predicted nucleic acid-binding protein